MSKGLEDLKKLAYENACCRCQYWDDDDCQNEGECIWLCIEKELKRLEDIDSYSSMRIENILPHLFEENGELKKRLNEMYELRDRYQKKLKALDIIRNKEVHITAIKNAESIKDYNDSPFFRKLTKEEYNLLKEILK